MMLAPDSTNLMAPWSARSRFIIWGYWWRMRSVGHHGPSRSWKNMGVLLLMTTCTWPSLRACAGGAGGRCGGAELGGGAVAVRACMLRMLPPAGAPHHFPTNTGSFFCSSTSITPVSSRNGYCSQMDAVRGKQGAGMWARELWA